jgi:choline-sulfatase
MSDHVRTVTRRRLLQGAGAAGVAAGLGSVLAGGQAQAAALPFTPRGRLRRRPNFLVFIVDEQRYPTVYESDELKRWRVANLPTQERLRRNGIDFANHYIMSAACQPSRASFMTGQYPSLHGVSQTSGAAKSAHESDLFWLDPTTVPTMGSWFRAAGYDTFYKGKWHVSDADLYQPGSYNPLPSYDNAGLPDPRLESVYLEAGVLEEYGFTGWVGPEPHGSNPLNSGSSGPGGRGRDEYFATQGVRQLRALRGSDRPWLMVNSYVNPHDITIWGTLSLAQQQFYLAQQLAGSNVPRDLFTDLYRASSTEDLSGKPTAQASYQATYPQVFQPLVNGLDYHRFYYQLQKNVDGQVGRVLSELESTPRQARDTIVIYLSDHGELLGSHGGLFQKWYSAYEEMLKVPFVVHSPTLFPEGATTDLLTSHADLLPTMLGLAGLDEEVLRTRLRQTHTQVRELPGRDLSAALLGDVTWEDVSDVPQYYMSEDEPSKGIQQIAWNGVNYAAVAQPNHIETVVATLPTGPDGAKERWKYTRYWDNPAFWTSPNSQNVETITSGRFNTPGPKTATTNVKAAQPSAGQVPPPPDEFELYNVSADPAELSNLFGVAAWAQVQSTMATLLDEQRRRKRLEPTSQPWADGSFVQFPPQNNPIQLPSPGASDG